MSDLRRSGRIAREIPILIVGTDVGGKVFAEETKTVLLSRHGAGILSRYKIAPEEILTMRLPGDTREAVIRLVGHMGERPDGFIYGVAFCDPNLDFWRHEFPADSPLKNPALLETTPCECAICHHRESFRQSEIETDVFAANDRILRYCKNCGQTTHWTLANPAAPVRSAPASAPLRPLPIANADSSVDSSRLAASITAATLELPGLEALSASAQAPSTASPTGAAEVISFLEPGAATTPVPPARVGKENRRRDVRTRVSFTACVRHPAAGEEIVECDNVSKGGFCFRSRRQYLDHSLIEASVPYTPGWTPIFVSGEIRHVEALPGNLFKYGVAYLKPSFEP
jgi:PilZ domain